MEGDHVENPRDFLSQRSKVKSQKSESGIQSRETAKKDSDEEAARRDSAKDLTGGGSAALTDRPDNQSGVTAKKRLIENGIYLVAITAKKDSDEETSTEGVGNCIMALLHKNVREYVEGGS